MARASYKLFHGMSAEQAHAELTQLHYLRAEQWQQHFTTGGCLLTGPEHAHEISVGLRSDWRPSRRSAPVVLELHAGFVVGGVLDQRADRNAAELRAQLRGRADEIAEEVVAGGSGARTWSGAVTALRQMLGGDDAQDLAEQRRATLADAVAQLTVLLGRAELPRPA